MADKSKPYEWMPALDCRALSPVKSRFFRRPPVLVIWNDEYSVEFVDSTEACCYKD